MKTFADYLFIALLTLLPFSFTSCGGDDDLEGNSDFIELTFNGKTYKESIPVFGYVFLEDVFTDSEGRGITITNVSIDAFEKYGFSFMPSIGHFARKADWEFAKTGECLHKYDFGNIWEGEFDVENFTLVTELEIYADGTFYGLMDGKHYVNSIKDVKDGVQVEGTFSGTYYCSENRGECEIHGRYRMTLNVI
jgi:hypothetical protein